MNLYKFTPFGQAILKIFANLESILRDEEKNLPPGFVRAYLFGGAAIHLYTQARTSRDVDAELTWYDDNGIIVYYSDETGEHILALDTNFNTGLVVLHPDYKADAIPLKCPPDSPLWVYVVAPVDLAVSKIKRFVEIDREDIRKLAEVGLVSPEDFERRVNEAVLYYHHPDDVLLKYNIRDAKRLIENNYVSNRVTEPI